VTKSDFDSDKTRHRTAALDPTAVRASDAAVTRHLTSDAVTRHRAGDAVTRPPAPPSPAAQAPPEFGAGYCLRGRYLLDQLIGQGAMGDVWRAKDLLAEEARDRHPYVAIKVLNSDFQGQTDAFVGLYREAMRSQKLAHENIVTVHMFDRDDATGRVFIAMELLEGQTLDQLLNEEATTGMPRKRAIPLIRGMAEGLAHAHRKGIVHADFKPANVFVMTDGTPKILDFGIARAVQVSGVVAPEEDGGFQGYTETYASPEVLRERPPTPADDVFALGVVAYELVMGAHPFKRKSALWALEPSALEPPYERVPLKGLTRRECRAIDKALTFEGRERFPNAGAFLKQLQRIPALQAALMVAVAVLTVASGGLWYRGYLTSLPSEALSALPAEVQQRFREQIRQGNESLDYHTRTHDLHGSDDAAGYFADAYRLHKKDPLAIAGLEAAANDEIEWYLKLSDRNAARTSLENLQAKSEYYQQYAPLKKAIRTLGGE
jgi:serine/threonine protein kinase